jgi:hypothetical protein
MSDEEEQPEPVTIQITTDFELFADQPEEE